MPNGILTLDELDELVNDYFNFDEFVVDLTGPCFEWGGYLDDKGYGMVKYQGKTWRTHRLAVVLSGRLLLPGECVLHGCDNRPCFSLPHLWIGSKADNNRDRDEKGRQVSLSGEDHGNSRFSDWDVNEMRRLRKGNWLLREIAEEFGTDCGTVSNICLGKSRIRV